MTSFLSVPLRCGQARGITFVSPPNQTRFDWFLFVFVVVRLVELRSFRPPTRLDSISFCSSSLWSGSWNYVRFAPLPDSIRLVSVRFRCGQARGITFVSPPYQTRFDWFLFVFVVVRLVELRSFRPTTRIDSISFCSSSLWSGSWNYVRFAPLPDSIRLVSVPLRCGQARGITFVSPPYQTRFD